MHKQIKSQCVEIYDSNNLLSLQKTQGKKSLSLRKNVTTMSSG